MMLLRESRLTNMHAERWNTIDQLFQEASDLPSPAREAFLRTRCGDDGELLREVRTLLDADASEPSFLDWSVPEEAAVAADARVRQRDGDLIGREVGNFTITRFIAAGGMGAVYEATQHQPKRTVAMKFLRAAWVTPAARSRFELESETLARMKHPGVAQIHDAGMIDDAMGPLLYFAMEYIADARTIIGYANDHDLTLAQRLELFALVCDAVQHGHQRGIIHRDLKPANILVDSSGQPKIIDFGVARLADSDIHLTRTTTPVVGTLAYMSPEQLASGGGGDDAQTIDTRSDVYALGVILYELLCGRLPCDVADRPLTEIVQRIREATPARPGSINAGISSELDAVMLKALEKEPERRYQSAAELAEDVRRFLRHEPVNARPPTAAYHLRKWARRHRPMVAAMVIGIGIAMVGLIVGLVVAAAQAVQARASEARAQEEANRAEAEAEAALQVSKSLIQLMRVMDPSEADRHFEQRSRLAQAPDALLDLTVGIITDQLWQHPLAQATLFEQIGVVYANMGRFEESQALIDRALNLRRTNQGEQHMDVSGSLASLSWLAYRKGDYPRALAAAQEAYDIALAAGGPDDVRTYSQLHALRNCHIVMGDYAQAEADSRELLAAVERGVPGASLEVPVIGLAAALQLCGKLDEAADMYQRGYDLCRTRLGDAHPETGGALYYLAHTQCRRGDIAAINQLLVVAQEQHRLAQTLAENHPHRSGALLLLGELKMAQGELDQAELLLRECLARRQADLPAGHRLIAYAQSMLGECLTRRGELDEAEQLLSESYEVLRREYGEHAAWAVDARGRMAQLQAVRTAPATSMPTATSLER